MACEHKEQVLRVLKGEIESESLLQHIEVCPECTALVEGYLEKSEEIATSQLEEAFMVPKKQNFKTYIHKYHKGRNRIIVFTLVGMMMGWFAINYISDSFLVTKIITAVPYKISELIYRCLYEPMPIYGQEGFFFPQAGIVGFLAERITPVLIGGGIYSSLGYFTGSRKIFTWRKYLRFITVWLGIIFVWIGGMFVGNEWSLKKNGALEGVNGFFLNAEDSGSGFYEDHRGDIYSIFKEALGNVGELEVLRQDEVSRSELETTVEIYMGLGRKNIVTVNWEYCYMFLDNGKILAVPQEFANLVEDFYYSKGMFTEE